MRNKTILVFLFSLTLLAFISIPVSAQGREVPSISVQPNAQNIPQYLSDAKHYWSFFVRQNAPLPFGDFEAFYGRYWKPGLSNNDIVRPVDSKIPSKERSPYVLSPKKP